MPVSKYIDIASPSSQRHQRHRSSQSIAQRADVQIVSRVRQGDALMTAAKPVKPARKPSGTGPGAPAGDSDGPALRVVPDQDDGLPPVPSRPILESLAGYTSLLDGLKAGQDEQRRKHDQLEAEAKTLHQQGEQDAAKERMAQAAEVWIEQEDADYQAAETIGAYLTDHPGAVPMLRDALRWFRAGWAPLPVKLDGTKSPLVADWRQYHGAGNGPTLAQVLDWFRHDHPGLAVMLGAVSGNRSCWSSRPGASGRATGTAGWSCCASAATPSWPTGT